jgi:hypothetical protein
MSIDWTNIYRQFKGLWVALDDDEKTVLGSGKTAKEALEEANSKGHSMPIMAHIPDSLSPYIGLHEVQL